MATGRTFNTAQAAQYLGVSEEAIRVAARSGALGGYRDTLHPGGPWRFSQADLDAYAASKRKVVTT